MEKRKKEKTAEKISDGELLDMLYEVLDSETFPLDYKRTEIVRLLEENR